MGKGTGMATLGRADRRRVAAVLAMALALAACADGTDENGANESGADRAGSTSTDRDPAGEATADEEVEPVEVEPSLTALGRAADFSNGVPHRTELSMALDGGEPVTLMSGEVVDDASEFSFDYGAMVELFAGRPLPPSLADVDLTFEMVIQPPTIYLRMPGLPELAETGDEITPELAELGDGWGRIDTGALGGRGAADVQAALVSQGTNPTSYLDLVAAAEGEVEELGTQTLRGEPVGGLRAELPLVDLLEGGGIDPGTAQERSDIDVFRTHLPMEVWLTALDEVRRVSYETDLATASAARGEDPAELGDLRDAEVTYTVDFFDYFDEAIAIDVPADSVDVTEVAARELAG